MRHNILAFGFIIVSIPSTHAQNVVTSRYDSYRQSATLTETILTRNAVKSASFAQLHSVPVDGQVYAQPLYLHGVTIPNSGVHNVVFVATEHDGVYAFDDATLAVLWNKSLLAVGLPGATSVIPVPSNDVGSGDLTPEIGITATPVIDASNGTIYVEAKTRETVAGRNHYVHRLHALDVATGNEKFGGPIIIADTTSPGATASYVYNSGPSVRGSGDGSVSGVVNFNALRQLCRPGLVLSAQTVYVSCASHGDNGPYHGWVLGYDAATLQLKAVFNTVPNGSEAGIWQSGDAPAVDAQGNLYVVTGNGTFDGTLSGGFPVNHNYGDTVLKISPDPASTALNPNPNGWGLKVADYFTPSNQASLSASDADVGSGGIMLLPDGAGPAVHPNLLVTAGKAAELYVIDRSNMGHYNPPTSGTPNPPNLIVQDLGGAVPGGGMFSGPSWYAGHLFLSGGALGRFSVTNGVIPPHADSGQSSAGTGFPGASATISANGAADGIAWVLSRSANQLIAHSTDDLSTALFRGSVPGGVVKFTVPTVAGGRVFAGSTNALTSWGLTGSLQQQTINFPALGTATFGDAPVALRATASSNLPVTYAIVSGPGRVTGSTLTITGAGAITVQASQAGDATWAPATATQTLNVNKASQTMTFAGPGNHTTSDGVLTLTAGAGASTSPVTFSVVSGSATIAGAALTLRGVGALTLKASQAADANYNAAPDVVRTIQVTLGSRAALAATGGTPQSTPVSSAFPTALQARVTDGGVALAGVPVTFAAPTGSVSGSFAAGSSFTVNTDASGNASVRVYTANSNAGSQTVTASIANGASAAFTLTNIATGPVEVTSKVQILRLRLIYSFRSHGFNGSVTVTNTSGAPMAGPLQLVFSALTPGFSVANATGTSSYGPYITLTGVPSLAPGTTATVNVQFAAPAFQPFDYTPRLFSGVFP